MRRMHVCDFVFCFCFVGFCLFVQYIVFNTFYWSVNFLFIFFFFERERGECERSRERFI